MKTQIVNLKGLVDSTVSDNINVAAVQGSITEFTGTTVPAAKTAFDNNADSKTTDFNDNANTKTEDYNTNHSNKLAEVAGVVDQISTAVSNTQTAATEASEAADSASTDRGLVAADLEATNADVESTESNRLDVIAYKNLAKSYRDDAKEAETNVNTALSHIEMLQEVFDTYADLPAEGIPGKTYVVIADETQFGATTGYRWGGTDGYIDMLADGMTGAEIKSLYENESDTNVYTDSEKSKVANVPSDTITELSEKQETLVSQTNIKSVNGSTLLGSGDLTIAAGSGGFAADLYFSNVTSTINGAYKTLSYEPDVAETQEVITCNSGETAGNVYLFELPIDTTVIDAGKWNANMYIDVSSNSGDTRLRYEGFMRNNAGVETTLFSILSPELADGPQYVEFESTQPVFNVDATARYGIRLFATTTSNSDKTVTITIGDGNASYTNTPLATRHDQLRARDKADSHPIGAITGLQDALDDKPSNAEMTSAIDQKVVDVINAAPEALDTLGELAASLGDDPNFATTVTNSIAGKVSKVTSTDNAIVRFDGTTGVVQNSGVTIDDNDTIGAKAIELLQGTTIPGVGLSHHTNGFAYVSGGANGAIFRANGQEYIRLLPNGNLGIGTTNPAEKLDVSGSIVCNNEVRFVDSSVRISRSGDNLQFRTAGVEKMSLDTSGNLTLTGTVDGRDVASDGSTLDNIGTQAQFDAIIKF